MVDASVRMVNAAHCAMSRRSNRTRGTPPSFFLKDVILGEISNAILQGRDSEQVRVTRDAGRFCKTCQVSALR